MLFLHASESGWTTADVLQLILGILLFISAIFLIVAVLMQTGKSKGVGAIAGGSSETYFGKNKGKSRDKKLALLTTIVAIIFVVMALLSFVIQPYHDHDAPDTTTTVGGTTSTTGGTTGTTAASGTTDSSATGTTTSSSAADAGANDTAPSEGENK